MTLEIALKHLAILGLFYTFYKVFLAKTTFHGANRAVLLASLAMSVVPFFWMEQTAALASYTLPAVGLDVPSSPVPTSSMLLPSFGEVYLLGLYLSACWLLARLLLVFRLYRESTPSDTQGLRWIAAHKSPCSFLFWSFIPKGLDATLNEKVILHERAHILMGHSLDRLLLEVFQVVFWFNPLLFLIRRELVKVHEYQADQYSHKQLDSYAEGILEYARWKQQTPLSSSINPYFNHLKTRINMLHQAPTKAVRKTLLLALLPLSLAAFVITACSDPSLSPDPDETTAIGPTSTRQTISNPRMNPEELEELQTQQANTAQLQSPPSYTGGTKALSLYLNSNLKYPEKEKAEGVMETIFLTFTVNKDGTLSNVKNLNGENENLINASITAIENMPNWIPGKNENNQPVAATMTLPIKWTIKE